ncbi:MAG: OST-HTH/LOTUS domain-containing protein [Luteimonas sp.]|nr:OST-HTH/LOTUS domain-containing protein [Luteimonas sp.]
MEYSEYLDLVIQLVGTHAQPDAPFPAAALGGLLRKAAPDVSFKNFGKRSLSEVLEDLQTRESIMLTVTDKGALAVQRTTVGEAETFKHTDFNPLRKVMWEAFAFTAPLGRRFLHRLSGSVRAGLNAPPAPVDEWVEITPISAETQRDWAAEFAKDLDSEVQTIVQPALQDESWSGYAFLSALRGQDPQAARSWNHFRSSRVSMHVQKWLADNTLPPSWAFQQPPSAIPQPKFIPSIASASDDEQETREILLAAIAQLHLSKLLEIPIPAGLLLSAISSRKSR